MIKKLGLILFAAGAGLFADCIQGVRPVTQAERDYYRETAAVLQRALPPAPPGWQREEGDRDVQQLAQVCRESDTSRLQYSVRYLPPQVLTELHELNLRNRALMRELPKARSAGNDAEVERINREMRLVAERSAELRHGTPHVELTLLVNEPTTVRSTSRGDVAVLRERGITRVVFGASSSARDLRVFSVTAKFQGNSEQIDLIMNGWDTTPLKALVERSQLVRVSLR
jgi:hypothetical protein